MGKYFGEAVSDISLRRGHPLGSSWAVAGQLHPLRGLNSCPRSLGRKSEKEASAAAYPKIWAP